jgi:hypothetical protein
MYLTTREGLKVLGIVALTALVIVIVVWAPH